MGSPRSFLKKEVAACLQPWLQTQGMYLMNAYSVVKVLTFRGLYLPIAALRGPLVGIFEKSFKKNESCPEKPGSSLHINKKNNQTLLKDSNSE